MGKRKVKKKEVKVNAFDGDMFDLFEKTYYSSEGGRDFTKTATLLGRPQEELQMYYVMCEYEDRIGELETKLEVASPKPRPAPGIVLPKAYPKILSLARRRKNILLVGPAGSGKTTIAQQVSVDLSLPFYSMSMSEGMSESQLLGRREPTKEGDFRYVPSPVVQAAENGGVLLIDEIDAGNSNTQICLNNILSGDKFHIPNRPDDGEIIKNKDFIAIASANTYGHGADRVYVGRNQLDGATLDRFRVGTVYLDYDENIERAIVKPDILEWGLKIRKAIRELSVRQILSTRFMKDLSDMYDDEGFKSPDEWWLTLTQSWGSDDRQKVAYKIEMGGV